MMLDVTPSRREAATEVHLALDVIEERVAPIVLVGGGKMGEAIVSGLVHGAQFDAESIVVAEPSEDRRAYLEEVFGVRCVADGGSVKNPSTCLLAVKPQVLRDVAAQLVATDGFRPQRVVSIAAGITTATLEELFGSVAIIRVMPNTPLMVGAGMSAVAVGEHTALSEGELVRDLFSLMGDAVLLEERLINAATALSGSGPAYFARVVRDLAKAGEEEGLDAALALRLVQQTMAGTARLLDLGGQAPDELVAAVASPGGTTQAALDSFDTQGLAQTMRQAVHSAVARAEELA
ncbi:MAG: pyrroline-5-carboxylate reductase [Coriobacteriales bacterium]|jgi:pyrroline-5-carboxylate reductase|nr:pyrroline-5-carboxylate reductase [Coriobacteriales bacterium]